MIPFDCESSFGPDGVLFYFKPLNATGANMHIILMLTESSGIERVKPRLASKWIFYRSSQI